MLTIRPEQLEAFRPAADAAFLQQVVDYVRDEHDDQAVQLTSGAFTVAQLPDDVLRELVRCGFERARAYGMTWESSITTFVILMFVVAPNFDEHPVIRHILRDGRVPPDSRLDELWERTSDENWEAAARKYSPSAWSPRAQAVAPEV